MKLLVVLAAVSVISAVNCSILSLVESKLESAIENVESTTAALEAEIEEIYAQFTEDVAGNITALEETIEAAVEEAESNANSSVIACIRNYRVSALSLVKSSTTSIYSCAAAKVKAIRSDISNLIAAAGEAKTWITSGLTDYKAALAFVTGSTTSIVSLTIEVSTLQSSLQKCAVTALASAAISVTSSVAKISLCSVKAIVS